MMNLSTYVLAYLLGLIGKRCAALIFTHTYLPTYLPSYLLHTFTHTLRIHTNTLSGLRIWI